jgi:hypothetical protein
MPWTKAAQDSASAWPSSRNLWRRMGAPSLPAAGGLARAASLLRRYLEHERGLLQPKQI